MSVFVIGRVKADRAKFEALFKSHADTFRKVQGIAKDAGVIHHRFVAAEGQVLIIDEWPDAESFEKFFANQPDIVGLMQAAGVTEPPAIEIYDCLASPDEI